MEEEDKKTEQKAWREVKYDKKFSHALRGLYVLFATTKTMHFLTYLVATVVVLFLGFYFCVSSSEWIALVFSIGLVMVAEAFNTAIEIDIDLTSPEYHPYAKDTKDVAAAAVLLAVFVAVTVGLIVFLPYFAIFLSN